MKKSLVIVAAALVLASACQKEQLVPEGNFSIKATREACVDTKATVSDAGAFAWVSGDAIGVYYGTGFSELTTTGSGTTATFTGTVVGTPQTCAIFPSSVAKSTTSVTLPDSYVWKNGDAPTPMYAEYNASGLAFKHLGGLVKISLSGVLAGAREFVITADKDITGDYSFVEEGGYKVIKTAGNASNKSVKFTFDAPASDMVFYVPVPVGTYKFAVSLNDAGGNELWKYSGSSDNVVTRAKLIVMPTLTIVALPGSGEGSATSVTVPENYNGTFYLPETSSDVYVKLNNTTGYISLEYSGSSKPANVVIDAAGKTVSDLRIVLPDSHVQVLNGTYANITAQTSLSTLVLEKDVQITGIATIEKGSATIASNAVGTVKVKSSVQDEAKIVLAPTAVVTTISTESSAPIVIQKEGENQGKVGTVNATQSTAIEFQNGATDPGDISTTPNVSKVNTSTSESTPGEEETTVKADSQSALAYAFKKGYDVVLANDIAIDSHLNVEKTCSMDLNGKTITNNVTLARAIDVLTGVKLTINGNEGKMIIPEGNTGSYGFIRLSGEGAKLEVNGGTYEGKTNNGQLFRANVNSCSINLSAVKAKTNTPVVSTQGGISSSVAVSGCVFDVNAESTIGEDIRVLYLENAYSDILNTSITLNGGSKSTFYDSAITLWGGEALIQKCVLKNNTTVSNWSSAIALSGGAEAIINGCDIYGEKYGIYIFNSGATANINSTVKAVQNVLRADTNQYFNSVFVINGGNYDGTVLLNGCDAYSASLDIKSGSFTNYSLNTNGHANALININGGTFDDPSALAYLADGAQVNIKLGANYTGPGFGLFSNGNGNNAFLDIDLGGHTWTLSDEPLFGSTGTVSQYFHLEKGTADGTEVNFKNGSIVVPETIAGKMLIQNYCTLTLDGVTLTGNANCSYIVSNNNGICNINNSTINAADGKCAFDVYSYSSYYGAIVNVTNSTINGKVEFGGDNGKRNIFLNVISGTLNGNLVVEEAYKTCASKNISIAKSGITYGDGVTGWSGYVK